MHAPAPPSPSAGSGLPHVLVVEDDAEIVNLLSRYLGGQGMSVSVAESAHQLHHVLGGREVDLILLDLGLPDADGLTLMRELRQRWHGPLIIVSGRGEPVERIVGLELGADDYVTKPFDLRELLARIRSVLRRAQPVAPPPERRDSQGFEFDGLKLDVAARQLHDRSGQPVALTTGEFELLLALLQRPHQVFSRDQLMNALHGRESGPYDRAIDVQIGRLRRKLEANPAEPAIIKSVRGAGYLFAAPVRRF